jgi:probable HAF family extracellular repeat protein
MLTDLGTLGGSNSWAYGINSAGQVVGDSITASGADHAFLYSNGTMTDLNSLIDPRSGWTLETASAINNKGEIVGVGLNANGQTDGFLLTMPNAALTAGGLTPPVATEGAPVSNAVLFHFSDADPNATTADYMAAVVWGDGSTNTSADGSGAVSVVANPSVGFDVVGSHAYAEEAKGLTFSVTVQDVGGASTSASVSNFSVADAALTAGALTPPVAMEGVLVSNAVLFHFTDANPGATAADYTAVVNWGDGASDSSAAANPVISVVANPSGGFDVVGSHTYAEEGNYTVSVVISDHSTYLNGFETPSSTNDWTDGATGMSGAGITLTTSGSGLLPSAPASGSSFAVVQNTNDIYQTGYGAGGYTYFGGAQGTYTGPFQQSVSIYINTDWTAPTNPSVPAFWLDETPYHQDPSNYGAEHNFRFWVDGSGTIKVTADNDSESNAIATITSSGWYTFQMMYYKTANPTDPALTDLNVFDATNTLVGSKTGLQATSPGGPLASSDLTGHGYAWLTVWQNGFANNQLAIDNLNTSVLSISASASVSVADAALTTNSFTPPVATEGAAFSGTVLNFSDADPNATAADYTAVVTPGDGNTVTLTRAASANGQIAAHGDGTFDVNLSYTYAEEVSGTFSVTVQDGGGASTGASVSNFSVADAALTAGALTPPSSALGTPVSHQVLFHFTDADPSGTAGDYTATVTWGDGSVETNIANPTDVQIVADGDGFDVVGSHTYTNGAAGLTFQVSVADQGAPAVGGSATIDVGTDVVVHGTAGGDNLVVGRTPGGGIGSITYILDGGAPVTLTNATSFTFDAGSGSATMTVSFANGDALVPGAIRFNGGAGSNALVVDAAGRAARTVPGDITVFGSGEQDISYVNVQATQLSNMMGVDESSGPDTLDRAAALAGLTGNERFVEALYLADLGRTGDVHNTSDAGYWVNLLSGGALDQAAVAAGVLHSHEGQTHLVTTWYQTYLGRQPVNGEEQYWVSQLAQGKTDEQVLSGILGSDEFFNRTGTAEGYVQGLYQQLLNRSGNAAEVAYWVNQLPQLGRQGVAQGFLEASEFRADQIEGYYNALLHRPDDLSGLNFWLSSNLDINADRLGFEGSAEFYSNG